MLLNKNKNQRSDNKIRFQHGQFAKKLDQQRNFKRQVRFVPTNIFDRTLVLVGLNSRPKQFLFLLILLGLAYLMYAPNILTVQRILVSGGSDQLNDELQQKLNTALQEAPFYYPKSNILVLSKKGVTQSILEDIRIYQVESIKKKYQQKTLEIKVIPRVETFLVYTPERVYDVYNDGYIKVVSGLTPGEWDDAQAAHMIKLRLPGNIEDNNQFILNENWVQKLLVIRSKLVESKIPALKFIAFGPERIEVDESGNIKPSLIKQLPIQPDELTINLTRPSGGSFDVILDPRGNVETAVERLILLLNQTQPDRLSKLKYIDVRLEERGFICLEDTACAQTESTTN